jgi:hypothetical protein
MDLFEALADLFEGFAEALFEGALKLLIDGLLHGGQVLGDGGPEGFRALIVLTGEALNSGGYFLAQRAALVSLILPEAFDVVSKAAFSRVGGARSEQEDQV